MTDRSSTARSTPAADIPALLRFLSKDAKLPLAAAMARVPALQRADLASVERLAGADPPALRAVFADDEKVAKQVGAAARRVSKKRAAGGAEGEGAPARKKTAKRSAAAEGSFFAAAEEGAESAAAADRSPAEQEAALALPRCDLPDRTLADVVLLTNRAPLVLAFVVTLLRYTHPRQPLSSRLSLAQAYVAVTSRARAVSLGITRGASAEEEGFGEGQPVVRILGTEIRVLKRWGYEWREQEGANDGTVTAIKGEDASGESATVSRDDEDEEPAIWGIDLEATKSSNTSTDGGTPAWKKHKSAAQSHLPIHTPQAARSYLLRAFDSYESTPSTAAKKPTAAAKAAEKERNLGMLLRALELLYEAWTAKLSPAELDNRTWGWYVQVRPDVAQGVAGWGGRNQLKLADILALRPKD